jgi:hypothetical protein
MNSNGVILTTLLALAVASSQPSRAATYQAHVAGAKCAGAATCKYIFPALPDPVEIHTISCSLGNDQTAQVTVNGTLSYAPVGPSPWAQYYLTSPLLYSQQAAIFSTQLAYSVPTGAKPVLEFTTTNLNGQVTNFTGNGDCMIEGTENP